MRRFQILAVLTVLLAPLGAQALQTSRFSPVGEVAEVRQVVVRFDEAVVPVGDPRRQHPSRCRAVARRQPATRAGPASVSGSMIWPGAGRRHTLHTAGRHVLQPLGGTLDGATEFSFPPAAGGRVGATTHLAAARRGPVLRADTERPGHARQRQGDAPGAAWKAWVSACPCASSRAPSAASCARRCDGRARSQGAAHLPPWPATAA